MNQQSPLEQPDDPSLWRCAIARVSREFETLSSDERQWVRQQLAEVARLQGFLHSLFEKASGLELCTRCQGGCCGCGKNHFTLLNLLAFLEKGLPIPEPDFSAPCPFLRPSGCVLDPSHRPFNCVTFICGDVEDALCEEDQRAFYAAEKSLRSIYEAFDTRFAGSSLRGLLIRARRLGAKGFLSRP